MRSKRSRRWPCRAVLVRLMAGGLIVCAGLLAGALLPTGALPQLDTLLPIDLLRQAEAGSWKDLTGRMAPDLTFQQSSQGLPTGTRLSSFRGKQVVLLAFWLRDCPHCKRELPKVQRLEELYGRSGLAVISIVHKHTPGQVARMMKKHGWTFKVTRDEKGNMARMYGGGRRPGYFVIGIDGRIKASNALNERVVRSELGKWRVHELGAMPDGLDAAVSSVRAGKYGSALLRAESVAKKPGASAEVQAAVKRLSGIAGQKLQNRADRAKAWAKAGQTARAAQEYRDIAKSFRGTTLESRAVALRDRFLRTSGAGG